MDSDGKPRDAKPNRLAFVLSLRNHSISAAVRLRSDVNTVTLVEAYLTVTVLSGLQLLESSRTLGGRFH